MAFVPQEGETVVLHGLKSRADLNGKTGVVLNYLPDSTPPRYSVRLTAVEGNPTMSLAEANLRVLNPAAASSGPSNSGGGASASGGSAQRSRQVQKVAAEEGDGEVSTVLIAAGARFVKSHKALSGTWVLGVLLLCFATGFEVSPENQDKYEEGMRSIDTKKAIHMEKQLWEAETEYRAAKGWFSCDAGCTKKYATYQKVQAEHAKVVAEQATQVAEAKGHLGIMSEQGVQETRDLFWDMFSKGRGFAKRSSFYDLIFAGISSMGRDENIAAFALRYLLNVLINFTMGLCGAFMGFVWYLWGVVQSFQPSAATGAAFFALAFIAGATVVVTFLLTMYGAAAGTVYVVAKAAHNQQRLEGGRHRPQPRHIRREHYE